MLSDRKLLHLEICRDRDVNSRSKTTGLADVELVHNAMPELDIDGIDLAARLFGKPLSAPVIISAMTGGHPATKKVNENLAKAAEDLGLGICVGSQRVAIEDPRMEDSFSIVRDVSSKLLVVANMGAAQLISPKAADFAERAIEMIGADAIAIHLNPLQELVQPRGDTKYRGVLKGLASLLKSIRKPIVVKETGCGISRDVAKSLITAGVSAIDVSGAGGTSWAAVEHYNAQLQGDETKADVAETMWDWGIPTAMSICEVASLKRKITLIASGGVKNGLEMAKCIALGADYVGIARPLILPAFSSPKEVSSRLSRMIYELKVAALLSGASSVSELQRSPIVIKGELLNWINQRNLVVRKND